MPELLATAAEQDLTDRPLHSISRTLHGQWELKLTVTPQSIQFVRCLVRAHLGYWERANAEFVASLGITELLTNVLKHAQGGNKKAVLFMQTTDDGICVTVSDFDRRLPDLRAVDTMREDGRGLPLLKALTDAMGVASTPYGKDIWFRTQCAWELPRQEDL